MRRDDPMVALFGSLFGKVNPDYDVEAPALLVRYCIGDEENPDGVIELRTNYGPFWIDSTFRDEIRALPLDSADDVDVREAEIRGPGNWAYLFDVWITGTAVGVLGNLAYAKIQALKQKYGPVSRTEFNAAEFDANQAREHTPSAEQQLLSLAKSAVADHYTVRGTLTPLAVDIKELRSESTFSGTAVLRDEGGSTFTVFADFDNYRWMGSRIIRSYPEEP